MTLLAIVGASGSAAEPPVVETVDTDRGEIVVSWQTEPGRSNVGTHPFTLVALPTLVTGAVRFERR